MKTDNYEVIFEEPTLYVDNESRKRSGHMTHALAAFSDTEFIDFNSTETARRLVLSAQNKTNTATSIWEAEYSQTGITFNILVR